MRDAAGQNNGSAQGTVEFTDGQVGQAFKFDGMGSFITAPTRGLPVGQADRTVEFWVRIERFIPQTQSTFIAYGTPGLDGQVLALGVLDDHRLFVSQWGDAAFGPSLNEGVWYHVAATMHSSMVSLYLDGVLVGEKPMVYSTASGTLLQVGQIPGQPFSGSIDEIGVFNRALFVQELVAIFRSGSHLYCIPPQFLSDPANLTFGAGASVTLRAPVFSWSPAAYQWQHQGLDILSGLGSTLTMSNIQPSDAGEYALVVTNSYGRVEGMVAQVTVVPILITNQPVAAKVYVGEDVTFSVGACCGALSYQWVRDGVPIAGATGADLRLSRVRLSDAGDYSVRVESERLATATNSSMARLEVVERAVHYVSAESRSPKPPYTSWETAANSIQQALDVALTGDDVVVTNGVYATGRGKIEGSSRIAVPVGVRVWSVNGPAVTVIQGSQTGENYRDLLRCAYLEPGAWLSGFTLTNGLSFASGGGVLPSTGATISNCWIMGNAAFDGGGGSGGYFNRCSFRGNYASSMGGGAEEARLEDCALVENYAHQGGAAYSGSLFGCSIINNSAWLKGGGTFSSYLSRCTILRNSAITGGAASFGTLESCVVRSNTGHDNGAVEFATLRGSAVIGNVCLGGVGAGGVQLCNLQNCTVVGNIGSETGGGSLSSFTNCIVFFNYGRVDANYSMSQFVNSCTTPLPAGRGNIDRDPQLADSYHILRTSPCSVAGRPTVGGLDIDGEPWLNPPSIGADQITRTAVGDLSAVIPGGNTHLEIGAELALSASVQGSRPITFQWLRNGSVIPGASNETFRIESAQVGDGGTYALSVVNQTGKRVSNPILVTVGVLDQPSANFFQDRALLAGDSGFLSGNNLSASREAGEPFHADKYGTNSVWYHWVAPSSGIVSFRTAGSTFDTLLGVYTGDRLSALIRVASDEDRGGFLTSDARFNAEAGVDYAIAIDGFASSVGTFILTWDLEVTPQVLPVITAQPQSQTVTAGSDVPLSVTAAGVGLTYQWRVNGQAIPGANAASLTLRGVGPSDVGSYTVAITNDVGRGVISLPASVEIGPEPAVHAQDKLEDLFVELRPPAPRLAGFAPVFLPLSMGTVSSHIASTVDATTQSWEPNHCGSIGGASVWFEFQAVTNGRVVIDTEGSTFDTVVAVYRKVGVRDLKQNELACNTDFRQGNAWSQVVFDAEAGQGYWVVVDGANPRDVSGRVHLNYAMGTPPRAEVTPVFSVVHPGQTRRLEAHGVEGLPRPEFQWLRNGQPVSGATNDWFEVREQGYGDQGLYTVVIRNAVGELQQIVESVTTPWYTGESRPAEGVYRIHLFPVPVPGGRLVLEQSGEMQAWAALYTHTDAAVAQDVDLPLAQAARRFFRVRLELPGSP